MDFPVGVDNYFLDRFDMNFLWGVDKDRDFLHGVDIDFVYWVNCE